MENQNETKDTSEKNNSESNDKIHVQYYETIQEGFEKYILTLINTGKIGWCTI